jgi:hypothetical protein
LPASYIKGENMTEPIMQFFSYSHLPEKLRDVSAPFGLLAQQVVTHLPRNPERTVALRKLLEAKDAAVRAALYVEPERESAGPP